MKKMKRAAVWLAVSLLSLAITCGCTKQEAVDIAGSVAEVLVDEYLQTESSSAIGTAQTGKEESQAKPSNTAKPEEQTTSEENIWGNVPDNSQVSEGIGLQFPDNGAEIAESSAPASGYSDYDDNVKPDGGDYNDPTGPTGQLDPYGTYTTKDDVALYLYTYNELPDNFITKSEAEALGWSGGGLEKYAPGKCIGGDKFGNREKILPTAKGRQYYECDIDTLGAKSRGAKRIVFSNDGLIYYTDDHYESFTLLYGD